MASIKRIDHVAIAVRDADQATRQYVNLLNAVHIRTEILGEKAGPVKVAYLQIGDSVLSLSCSRWRPMASSTSIFPSTAKVCTTWAWKWTT